MNTGVNQRLSHGLIGIQQFHILADHGDGYQTLGIHMTVDDKIPLTEIRLRQIHTETVEYKLVQTLLVEHTRNHIDRRSIDNRNNRSRFYVGK